MSNPTYQYLRAQQWILIRSENIDNPILLFVHGGTGTSQPALKYFDFLKAPSKTLYWFENSAHLPNTEERELFNKILYEKILSMINMNDSKHIEKADTVNQCVTESDIH